MNEEGTASWRVVAPRDEIDMYSAPHLREALLKGITDGQRGVVLDLSGVTFVDSSGFAVIVSGLKRLRDSGAELRVCGAVTAVRSAMRISGIESIVAVYPDLAAALENDQDEAEESAR